VVCPIWNWLNAQNGASTKSSRVFFINQRYKNLCSSTLPSGEMRNSKLLICSFHFG
jgi:hypothetical protein